MSKTIAAICTSLKASAIGIIRISGDDAINVAKCVFRPVDKTKKIENMKRHTAAYGHVFDDDGEFDDGVLTVFLAPHSYTGENTVELSLHGGETVLRRALRAIMKNGAEQAGGGEFTKRALLNGKMSLTQAEAVMDIISAENNDALNCAVNIKNGAVYKKINELCERLSYLDASAVQFIDFPEEGEQEYDYSALTDGLNGVKTELCRLIDDFDTGRRIRHGIDCSIVGRPNVGKSTLMNLLTKTDRSIVTSIAGTTRDIVEETVDLDGLTLHLSDTAGIHQSDDEVESIGIDKARSRINSSQLILAVFSADAALSVDDFDILDSIKPKPHIIIMNKTDIGKDGILPILQKYGKVVPISAKEHIGIDELKEAIVEIVGQGKIDGDSIYLANERQLNMAIKAKEALDDALYALNGGLTIDAVTVSIDSAIDALLRLSGKKVSDTVIAQVFENFCVGK